MAVLTQTLTNRLVASKIIRAASHIAAQQGLLSENLLQCYLELCQDPDISIRKNTLIDLSGLLRDVTPKSAELDFFPEVSTFYSLRTSEKKRPPNR